METLDKNNESKGKKRASKRDPEGSRQALIDATLDTIAEIGITDTTVTSIIKRADLSRGMIHLHFGGKDKLLSSAAKHYSDVYYAELEKSLQQAGTDPEAIIMAVVRTDLGPSLLNERSAKVWHAFRGVAHSHPGIAEYSSTQDERLKGILHKAFEQLTREVSVGGQLNARQATFGTFALLEGMWVHFLSDMEGFSREEAVSLIQKFLSGMFPGHFAEV